MAITTFTGDLSAQFAAGTSLEARPASNWPAAKRPPEAGTTPVGSAAATAASNSAGVLSLTGLADSTEYYVSDAAGTRYVRVTTFPERQEVMTSDKGRANGVADLDADSLVPRSHLLLQVFNVKDPIYGAKIDGSTDDTAAVQAAIDAAYAAGGGIVFIPAGTCYIATGLLGKAGVQIQGAGKNRTTLKFADVASIGIDFSGAGPNTNTLLTTALVDGDLTSTFTSVTGFAAGDHVYLRASADVNYGNWVPRIRSIAGAVVTWDEPSPADIPLAQTPQAFAYTWMRNFGVSDLAFTNAAGTPATRVYYVKFNRFVDAFVERCSFNGLGGGSCAAIVGITGRGLRLHDNDFDNIKAASTSAGVIDLTSVTSASIRGNISRDSTGGCSLAGCPKFVEIGNVWGGAGAVSAGRGSKIIQGSHHGTYGNNDVSNFGTTHTLLHVTDSSYVAIVGNDFQNGGPIQIGNLAGRTHHVAFKANSVRNVTGNGVNWSPASGDPMDSLCEGNAIDNTSGSSIYVQGTRITLGPNVMTNFGGSDPVTQVGANYANTFTPPDTVYSPTYGATVTPRPSLGRTQRIVATNGTAFTIAAPTTLFTGMELEVEIVNSSGGALGAITWNAVFALAGAFTNPANGKTRRIRFVFNGTNMIESGRVAADV